jgi:hypothetical protein
MKNGWPTGYTEKNMGYRWLKCIGESKPEKNQHQCRRKRTERIDGGAWQRVYWFDRNGSGAIKVEKNERSFVLAFFTNFYRIVLEPRLKYIAE